MNKLIIYARPGGGHIHFNKYCPMLEGSQFDHYKYKEISIDEAIRRKLFVCVCVYNTFGKHNHLTPRGVKSLAEHIGLEV